MFTGRPPVPNYDDPDVAGFPLSLMYGAVARSGSTPMIMSERTCTSRKNRDGSTGIPCNLHHQGRRVSVVRRV